MAPRKKTKDEHILLRASREQKERWSKEAERMGISLAALIALRVDGHMPKVA